MTDIPRRGIYSYLAIVTFCMGLLIACTSGPSLDEPAFVLPERLRLRSSTAQASRFVKELKGGDPVTITGRATSDEGAPWVKVRGPAGEVGWAESRYFVGKDVVDRSRRIEEESRGIQTQAVGRSKATLRLRLTPDRTNDANTAAMLPAGTLMEIVGRRRVPKPDQPAAPNAQDSGGLVYDDWLLVRLKDFAILPAGWIYGGSVDLEIPPDIYYFNTRGRRITGWQRIATIHGEDGRSGDHYLVMERRTSGGDERADFDRIKILAYHPATREYSTPFTQDIAGVYPVTLKMNGSKGEFRIIAVEAEGRNRVLSYGIELLAGGKVSVTRPGK